MNARCVVTLKVIDICDGDTSHRKCLGACCSKLRAKSLTNHGMHLRVSDRRVPPPRQDHGRVCQISRLPCTCENETNRPVINKAHIEESYRANYEAATQVIVNR